MIDETPEAMPEYYAPEVESTEVVEYSPEPVAVEPEPTITVVEPEPQPEPEPEPVAAEEPKSKNSKEEKSKLVGEKRSVSLSKLVFKSREKNSNSVGLVQFRLYELGYTQAREDRYGWLCEGTKKALAEFARVEENEVNLKDEKLINRLFEGTDVEVSL